MRRYAEGTKVGASRSREQITRLLRDWGAEGVQWSDHFAPEREIILRFIWKYEGARLCARFNLRCDRKRIEENSIDGRTGKPNPNAYQRNLDRWDGEAHRLLFLFLKGAMYAVDAGLIKAEQLFMPFFEDKNGQVVGELMLERLKELPKLSGVKLLESPKEASY